MKPQVKSTILFLFFYLISTLARAEYDFQVGGLYYKVISLDDLTCSVVEPEDSVDKTYRGDIVIPDTVSIGGRVFEIIKISGEAFALSKITSIVIGENVREIEAGAFNGSSQLVRVSMGNGVQIIGKYAFAGCKNLKHLELSSALREIHADAFIRLNSLTGVITIPSTCEWVGGENFTEIWSDFSIKIEDGSTPLTMFDFAFGKYGGKSIYIGRNLKSDNHHPGLYEYDEIIFGDGVTEMPACYRTNERWSNSRDKKIRRLIIGKSIKEIPSIFMDIEYLEMRNPEPPTVNEFSEKVYVDTKLCVPKGSLSKYQTAEGWKKFWTIEEI